MYNGVNTNLPQLFSKHSVLFLNLVHLKAYISNNEAATRVPGECDCLSTLKIDIEVFNELVLCLNVVPK